MPDIKEKLVELIGDLYGVDPMYFGVDAPAIAEHLIAHGVTIQEWIPVEERLPKFGCRVLACGEKGGVFLVKAEGATIGFGRMDGSSKYRSFTHWMPLPEPPKGE